MSKFEVTYSVNRLYSTIIEASDKEAAINIMNGGHGSDEDEVISEEYLGMNTVMDVTHEYPEDGKPKAKNPRPTNSTH